MTNRLCDPINVTAIWYTATTTTKTNKREGQTARPGTSIIKRFNVRLYQGWFIGIDRTHGYYKIVYDDGNTENLTYKEVKKHQNGPPPNQFQQTRIAQANRVVAAAQRQLKDTRKHTREPTLPPQLAFAVYDKASGKTLEYKDLINHPDPIIQSR